jgi:hypothetical protein
MTLKIIPKVHRTIGLVLLLPFLGWAVTGFVFFLKPGYGGAYELLQFRTYPLDGSLSVRADPSWLEFKCIRTILGDHLLVRTATGKLHLDPGTVLPKAAPTEDQVKMLVGDSFSANPMRYGHITEVSNDLVITDTGVRVILDWNAMSLQQRGQDTDRIDLLYRVHYLQWTGIKTVDRVVGPLGLLLVAMLSVLGVYLAIAGRSVAGLKSEPRGPFSAKSS